MKAFSEWSKESDAFFSERNVVAFDLDDTLTDRGALPSAVIRALEEVQKAGWMTVLVTGRSAGWVDALIKLLPFDAVVGENGALLYFWPKLKINRREREEAKKLFWSAGRYTSDIPKDLQDNFEKTKQAVFKKYPRARVASDQRYRTYDLAIDFAEEVDPPLSLDDAEGIQKIFAGLGATAKVSSIHVNGWWGAFTKENGLRELLEMHFNRSLEKNVIYSGDSPNDGPLFKAAGLSVGVANIKVFLGKSDFHLPTFVTENESAHGALEILSRLQTMRRQS